MAIGSYYNAVALDNEKAAAAWRALLAIDSTDVTATNNLAGVTDAKTIHRIEASVVKAEVIAAGFVFDGELTALANPADAVYLVRDLVNTPASDLGPAELEAAARKLAAAHRAKFRVTKGAALHRDFPMIHAVGRASAAPCG